MAFKPIYRSNNYRLFYQVLGPNSENEDVGVAGLAVNMRLAFTPYDPDIPGSGVAIDTSLNKTATELTGMTGGYEAVFLGEDIDAYIPDTSTQVWGIVSIGVGTVLCSNRIAVQGKRRAE